MSTSEVYLSSADNNLNGVSSETNGYVDSDVATNGLPPAKAGPSKVSASKSNGKLVMDYKSDFPGNSPQNRGS